jgi:hypothetical protein
VAIGFQLAAPVWFFPVEVGVDAVAAPWCGPLAIRVARAMYSIMSSTLPHHDDRPLRLRRRLICIAAGIACYLLLLILQNYPWATERLYATTISPALTRAISRVFGIVPFAVFELVILVVIGQVLFAFARAARQVIRRTRRLSNAAASGLLRLGQDAGVLLALFYIVWGFNYVRPRLDARLGYDSKAAVADARELAGLTRQLVDAAEAAYVELHRTADAGAPTAMPADQRSILAALDFGWQRATGELRLPANTAKSYGPPKFPLSSTLARYMGISGGMFFPYTAEALVVRDLPAQQLVKTMAHEQAHQRGTAVEADANALAFFVCAWSPHPLARYAGFSFARDQMLAELARVDPAAFRTESGRMGPGVQRDRRALRDYWRRTRVASAELANRVNDASLRANRVSEGVRSYSLSTRVFIEFARSRGGAIVPSLDATAGAFAPSNR